VAHLGEKFRDILGPFGKVFGTEGIVALIPKQRSVFLQECTASGGVHNNCVELSPIECVDNSPCERPGCSDIPVMTVQGTAAALSLRDNDFKAVSQQDVDNVPVDLGKYHIHDASREERDSSPGGARGREQFLDRFIEKLVRHSWKHRMFIPQSTGPVFQE